MRRTSFVKRLGAVLCAFLLSWGSFVISFAADVPWKLGEPLSSYNMGSAGNLEGRNLIISVFVDTMYCRWSEEERETSLKRLDASCKYLEEGAEESEIGLEMVYDWRECPDLRYDTRVFFPVNDSDDTTNKIGNCVAFWSEYKTNYEKLLKRYGADGIFICVHFLEEGRSYAICYDGLDIPEESLILYSNSNAATCAHEMLHLFGAHDFYRGAEYTDECVDYLMEQYPDEIMLDTQEKQFYNITKKISPVTAYHIGWTDRIPDTDEYPQLKR